MADVEAIFKKKIAGLPAGVWLLIIVAGVGIGLYVRNRAVDTQVDESEDLEGEDGAADIIPVEDLPSDDPGYFPITGGGPPTVYGGGALRLTPDTLRIRVVYPKRKRKKHRGGGGGGGGGGRNNRTLPPVSRMTRQRRRTPSVNAHNSVA